MYAGQVLANCTATVLQFKKQTQKLKSTSIKTMTFQSDGEEMEFSSLLTRNTWLTLGLVMSLKSRCYFVSTLE